MYIFDFVILLCFIHKIINIRLDNEHGIRVVLEMYGVTIQKIDVEVCIPPEDDPEIGPKHVVGKNKTLILHSCGDGVIVMISMHKGYSGSNFR
jgi:hypothetical protein